MEQEKDFVMPFLNARGESIMVDLRTVGGVARNAFDPDISLLEIAGIGVSVQCRPDYVEMAARALGLEILILEADKIPADGASSTEPAIDLGAPAP